MPDKPTRDESLLSSLTTGAGVAIITGLIGFALSTLLGLSDDLKSVAVGASVLLGSLVVAYFRRGVSTFSEDLGKRYMNERTGIVTVFRNLEECKKDMQTEFEKASDIRLLLQIGRRELGDSEPSYFWTLAKQKTRPGTQIRVLRASEESPFLSKDRAKFRETPVERWREDLRRLAREINILKDVYHVKVEEREHREPYLWRIFLFDDIAYVSAYLHQSDNDRKTVVYKLHKGENSLFVVFSKYFDYLWLKYDLSTSNEVQKWSTWV